MTSGECLHEMGSSVNYKTLTIQKEEEEEEKHQGNWMCHRVRGGQAKWLEDWPKGRKEQNCIPQATKHVFREITSIEAQEMKGEDK